MYPTFFENVPYILLNARGEGAEGEGKRGKFEVDARQICRVFLLTAAVLEGLARQFWMGFRGSFGGWEGVFVRGELESGVKMAFGMLHFRGRFELVYDDITLF